MPATPGKLGKAASLENSVQVLEGIIAEEVTAKMKVLGIKEELMDVEEALVQANLSEIDAFIKDVLVEHFYPVDVITPDLFEEEELFVTKVNDMISDFA